MNDSKPTFAPRIPDHEIVKWIGSGSYGDVWLARNVFGTLRAVKTVRREAFDSARPYERELAGIQRFEPVSRGHEALVDILQVGRNEAEGFFYYVMELADPAPRPGSMDAPAPSAEESYEPLTLNTSLDLGGRIPIRECVLLFRGLAIGLSYLHRAGLVHRDIKPSNIIFVGGTAKFADIGLVTSTDESLSHVGTEGFIPPEGAGTVAGDIFSLGKVLYEAATGRDRTEFPSLPELDSEAEDFDGLMELNAVWLKACAALPAERYETADELASDLALLQAGRSVRRLRMVERRIRRARRLALLVGAVALLFGSAGLLANRQAAREKSFRLESDRLRLRAERAEREARRSLEASRIAQASAELHTPRMGRRDVVLSLLTNTFGSDLRVQARSLAAAALALPDLVPTELTGAPPEGPVAEPQSNGSIVIRPRRGGPIQQTLAPQDEAPRPPFTFTVDARYLYAGYGRFTERIWDLANSRVVARLDTNYYMLEFRPGRDEVAVAYVDGPIRLHSLPDWKVLQEWPVGRGELGLRWSPGGASLAMFCSQSPAVLVEPDQRASKPLVISDSPVHFLNWHPDGVHMVMGGDDGHVLVRSLSSGPDFVMDLRHEAQIVGATFLPPFPWLLTSSWDGTSRLWDWHANAELGRMESTGYGIEYDSTKRLVHWRVGPQPEVRPWRLTGESVHREIAYGNPTAMGGPYMLAWSGDSRLLAGADADGVHLWRQGDGVERLLLPGYSEGVWLAPSGREIIANSAGFIRRWSLERSLDDSFQIVREEKLAPAPAEGKLAVNRDGSVLAWLNFDELWVRQGEGMTRIRHGQALAEIVALSPDGRLVAVGTRNHIGARVFQAATGHLLWNTNISYGTHLAFSHDSRWLAIGSESGCRLFEAESGRLRWHAAPAPGEEPSFWEVAFSPDDRIVAWTVKSSQVRLLHAEIGKEILTLDYPTRRYITRLMFSPDGEWLAEASNKRTIHLWNIHSLRAQLEAMNLGWED